MKNLKFVYKLLFIIPLALMVGCIAGSDDINDVFTNTTTTQENSVFIETDDASEIIRVTGTNIAQTITVGVNNALESDVTVAFNVLKDGAAAVLGVDYTLADATILASDNFGTSDVTFLAEGSYEVTISSSSGGSLEVVTNKALFVVPPPVTFTISWANSFYDYDLFLVTGDQDLNGDLLAFSNGVTASETFDAVPAQGATSIYIQDFWGDNASIPVTFTIDVPGEGTQQFDIIMDVSKFVIVIETSVTEDGDIEYSFTQVNQV